MIEKSSNTIDIVVYNTNESCHDDLSHESSVAFSELFLRIQMVKAIGRA